MVEIKASKPIKQLKKGEKVKIDGRAWEIDFHGILMEHNDGKGGKVPEMVMEIFDPKTDEDGQVRYFENNLEMSLEFYLLKDDILYVRKNFEKIEW